MQQYFVDTEIVDNVKSIAIDDGELFRHLIKVLRMKTGDQCLLVDSKQKRVLATISETEPVLKFDLAEIENDIGTEFDFSPIIACSLSKKDKLEWIAQKSTEMGAKQIVFFDSRFSIMKWDDKNATKKVARLQEIVKNAAQQSHRKMVPEVVYVGSLTELITKYKDVNHKLVAYEEVAKQGEPSKIAQVLDQVAGDEQIICLFGPEGGFDPQEITQLTDNNYLKVGLGPRILRAETAPLFFLGALSYKFDLM